ncbi:uncharacterized protein BDV17DRAFT_279716 [Aspergillus undulatus]|uniref:uncharacterized protein n=1 Tax=Aspergillus undulatus TaxID=1810928 RepID=UPI003CCD85B6
MHHAIFFPLFAFIAITVAQCPEPTETVTIEWPDDLYARRQIIVSSIDSDGDTTTYEGVDCPGNPHRLTIAFGPQTFSFNRVGSNQEGHTLIDECQPEGSGMDCTISVLGVAPTTYTTSYGSDDIYTVSMAVVSSGAENTVLPTMTAPPYFGCPNAWQQCGEEPWCCPTTAAICTTAPNNHEACASVSNEEFPQPALPYITTPQIDPDSSEPTDTNDNPDSEDGAAHFAAQPTHLLLGGLAGLGLAFI